MFGMGMNEILIILAIAVIVIGPKQLPQVARAMGKMVAQFKRATNDLRSTVSEEIGQHVSMDELHDIKSSLESEVYDLEKEGRSYLENEFEDERKIGGGVARDLKDAVEDLPSRDFDLAPDNGDDPKKKKTAAKGRKKAGAASGGKSVAKAAAKKSTQKTTPQKSAQQARPLPRARGRAVTASKSVSKSAGGSVRKTSGKAAGKTTARATTARNTAARSAEKPHGSRYA